MIKNIRFVFAGGAILVATLVIGAYYYRSTEKSSPPSIFVQPNASSSPIRASLSHDSCLAADEYADFPVSEKRNTFYDLPNSSTIDVYVKNKATDDAISNFKIENVDYPNGHALEFHQCAIYVLEEFGQDIRKSFPPGYNVQLWRYDYGGVGKELFEMFAISSTSAEENFYYPDFSVDPNEHYLALQQGQGSAVVIDDPKTTENHFTLPISDITKKFPNIVGEVGFEPGGWSSDGRYFWFDFFQDADILGFVRIDTTDWSYRAFAAPITTMGGDAFNPNTGMVTYETNVAPWTGDAGIDQQYRDQAIRTGQIASFYIYNLLTNKNYLVATTTDPTYYYQPKWISNSVLGYTLSSDVTSTYTISQ